MNCACAYPSKRKSSICPNRSITIGFIRRVFLGNVRRSKNFIVKWQFPWRLPVEQGAIARSITELNQLHRLGGQPVSR